VNRREVRPRLRAGRLAGSATSFPDYDDPALVECGLVIVNEQGRRYDRFRDRVMFPSSTSAAT